MIDEARTLELFGYTSGELSPRSHKHIVAICDGCGIVREAMKDKYRDLCPICAHSQKKYQPDYAVRSIDYAGTFKRFGYDASELSPASSQKVVAVCVDCDDRYETAKRSMDSSHVPGRCPNCATKVRVLNRCGRDFTLRSLDDVETFKKFGYHAYDLPAGSGKYVIAVCTNCGRRRAVRKALYRDLCRQCTMKTDSRRRIQSAAIQGISYDEWESFAKDHPYCPKFNEACRESNREKYDRRCFLSGITEEENGQKLSVHHYDMNKEQGCNGHAWKLVPLCRKLHSTSHTQTWVARIVYLLEHVWGA